MARLPPLGGVPFHLSVLSTGSAAIAAKHAEVAASLGGATGEPTLFDNPHPAHPGDRPAVRRGFEHGTIYWSDGTGAHEQHGPHFAKYLELGGELSPLGLPTTDVGVTLDGAGAASRFQLGAILTGPGMATLAVLGAIHQKWAALGSEAAFLGYPLGNELPVGDGVGRVQDFQHGSIHWHPETGAWELHGDIKARWLELGGHESYLGFPITDEMDWVDPDTQEPGRISHFQRGAIGWRQRDRQVVEFPERLVFQSGHIGVSAIGGNVELTLTSAGTFHFKGHLHNGGVVTLTCTVVASMGIPGTSSAIVVTHEGSMGGPLPLDSRNDDWNDSGFKQEIRNHWQQLRHVPPMVTKIEVGLGILETLIATVLVLVGAAVVIFLIPGGQPPESTCDATGQHVLTDGNNNTIVEPSGVRCIRP